MEKGHETQGMVWAKGFYMYCIGRGAGMDMDRQTDGGSAKETRRGLYCIKRGKELIREFGFLIYFSAVCTLEEGSGRSALLESSAGC